MTFRWQADDGLLIVVIGSPHPLMNEKKTLSKLEKWGEKFDSLWQNFLDPRIWDFIDH